MSDKKWIIPTFDVLMLDGTEYLGVTARLSDRVAWEDIRARHNWTGDGYSNHAVAYWTWRHLKSDGRIDMEYEAFMDNVAQIEDANATTVTPTQ